MTEELGKDRRFRVFVVEDHPIVREHLSHLLNMQRDLAVCGEAVNLSEALEKMTIAMPDVAIIDISLRESNGLELLKAIRARGWNLPVLMLSMHEQALYAERAIRAGANGYVSKQEPSSVILAALRTIIAGRIHVSPEVSDLILKRLMGGMREGGISPVARLADRELEVFQMIGRGRGSKQIADALGVSVKTIETYRARIKEKLSISDAYELTRRAIQWVEAYEAQAVDSPRDTRNPAL